MVGVVVSRFNDLITERLLDGAAKILEENGIEFDVHWVEGSFEIPQMIAKLLRESDKDYEGFIALGCIIKGETDHNEHIARAVSYGLMKLAIEKDIPITFGILTVDSIEQALNRAGGKFGNKGEEAARALLPLIR